MSTLHRIAAAELSRDELLSTLEADGVVVIDGLLSATMLAGMQRAFASRLEHMTFNTASGFVAEDNFRDMVHDVMTLHRGFVELALHDVLMETVRGYVGRDFIMTEAKGWRSRETTQHFHGWHNDAWYDHDLDEVPRQLKIAVYLTDVEAGAFEYIPGSHGQRRAGHWSDGQARALTGRAPVTCVGGAGTVILFDTSGVHRQQTPIPSERRACFLVYNDPEIPLQRCDVDAYRYHPLLLNAALLGGLSAEQMRILGVGNQSLYRETWRPAPERARHARSVERVARALMHAEYTADRVARRVSRGIGQIARLVPAWR